jgi:hypothetical protein
MELKSIPSRLECLPIELLGIIVSSISESTDLISLSCVNRLLRRLCVPLLFQYLSVGFSTVGLDRLLMVSRSYLAPYVKTISYEASALVDPREFPACIAEGNL